MQRHCLMQAQKSFDVWNMSIIRHDGVEMLLRVFLVLGGTLVRMIGEHDHAVRVFAAVLVLHLVAMTGTPTITVPLVSAQAFNVD